MTTQKIQTNNEQIAANLKATFEASDTRLTSALTALFSKPADPEPRETSNLGAVKFGLFRERLRIPVSRPSKLDRRA